MANVKFNIKINDSKCRAIEQAVDDALLLTMEALHTEVVQAQVMPFDTGNMQNESTRVEKAGKRKVRLVTSTPYAARLYYHPEYNFNKASNSRAQGRWLESWINGKDKSFAQEQFGKILSEKIKGV